jgi:hypothetical protein
MSVISLGKVTVASAGTPVNITVNFTDLDTREHHRAKAIQIQALPGNAGDVYVGLKGLLTKATLVGVLAVLSPGMTYREQLGETQNGLSVRDFSIDADTNNDAAVVSYTRH